MTIDFTPFINFGVEFLLAILVAIASWALKRLSEKLSIEAYEPIVEKAIHNGLNTGVHQLSKELMKDKDFKVTINQPDTEDKLLSMAFNYAKDYAPESMKKAKYTAENVKQEIIANLPDYLDKLAETVEKKQEMTKKSKSKK